MTILGIESSCDETAVSLLKVMRGKFSLRHHGVSSQIKIHEKTGGVVPEVAARHHVPVLPHMLSRAVGSSRPDCIAVTTGPGLVTSLLVGVETAKTLSYLWDIPLIPINHIEGHIYANWLLCPHIPFPALALVVSGGHTELILMRGHGHYTCIGRTRDDAAGEAFDKIANLLGLPYPGGPSLSNAARTGDANAFAFPRPMLNSQDSDFSFSGLKTAVLYCLRDLSRVQRLTPAVLSDICASVEQAIVDVLVVKTLAAAEKFHVVSIVGCGGVMANRRLRHQLRHAIKKKFPQVPLYVPPMKFCTDNASMIAAAGYFHAKNKNFSSWHVVQANPQWELA